MRLYLDEDLASRELVDRLKASGHEVVPALLGEPDSIVWAEAQSREAAVATRNARDFVALAGQSRTHHGLLLVYLDNDRRRDMNFGDIATAIDRVDSLTTGRVEGQILILNRFREP